MIIGLHSLDLVPKKAAGTAAGFTGFFGYVFGSAISGTGVGWIADRWGWGGVFIDHGGVLPADDLLQRADPRTSRRERGASRCLKRGRVTRGSASAHRRAPRAARPSHGS